MKNEKGLIQVIVLIILLIGIAVAVYLSQNTQIFKPKASEGDIALNTSPQPIASWLFNDQSTTVTDSASRANANGAWVGEPHYSTERSGGAAVFTGNSFIQFGAGNDTLRAKFLKDNFTFSGWIKAQSGATGTILNWGDGFGARQNKFVAIYLSENKLAFSVRGDSGERNTITIRSEEPITDGSWHYFAIVRNLGAEPPSTSLYIDGALVAQTPDNAGFITFSPEKGQRGLTIGASTAEDPNAGSSFFTGSLDDMKIFDTPLSAENIKQDFSPQQQQQQPASTIEQGQPSQQQQTDSTIEKGQPSQQQSPTSPPSIIGSVFVDTNDDGIYNQGEQYYGSKTYNGGTQGVTVLLRTYKTPPSTEGDIPKINNPVSVDLTDGSYKFYNVPEGKYWLDISIPDGYKITRNNSRVVNIPHQNSDNFNFALKPLLTCDIITPEPYVLSGGQKDIEFSASGDVAEDGQLSWGSQTIVSIGSSNRNKLFQGRVTTPGTHVLTVTRYGGPTGRIAETTCKFTVSGTLNQGESRNPNN